MSNPHPTRDELLNKAREFFKPVTDPVKERKEEIKFYFNTAYEHSQRISPLINRKYSQLESGTHRLMRPFHHYRREMGWEMITGATLAISLASFGYGLQATSRNALFAATLSTLLINPEYMYDMYKYYSVAGSHTVDSSNKSTFRW